MQTSDEGLQFIRKHEGLRLNAYRDVGGVWTIGVGHIRGVRQGMTCTEEQALAWLREDVKDAERCVDKCVRVELTQSQYDALVSFVFNLGCGAFSGSTLLKRLNSRDQEGAVKEFSRWVHVGKAVVHGLVVRRADEADLFVRDIA